MSHTYEPDSSFPPSTSSSSIREKEVDRSGENADKSIQQDAEKAEQTVHGLPPFRKARLAHIEGWRLWVLITCLAGGLLISSLEVTIIGTALIDISSNLGDFQRSSWVVTTYLASYCGFVIIFARISDIFGRRTTWLGALGFFVLASIACGASSTMTQLIVFRAFQGIGGGGLYALAMSVATEVPGRLRAPINSILSSTFAISSAIGPLIGGAIASNTSWRWVFLINVPIGVAVFAVSCWVFPKNPFPLSYDKTAFRRVDYLGAILSLGCVELVSLSLQMGGVYYRWDGAEMIALLTVTGCCWIAFFGWEITISSRQRKTLVLPIWPCDLFFRRIMVGGFLSALFSGVGFIAVIVYLPQRFQIQNGDSAIMAGVRMLAYLLVSSFFAGIAAVVVLFKNLLFPFMVFSGVMQIIGLGLLSTLPSTIGIFPGQYGYQVILGVGFGIALSVLPLVTRVEVTRTDHAMNMGASTQARLTGSLIGVGFGEVVITSRVWERLDAILTPEELGAVMTSPSNASMLGEIKRQTLQSLFGDACNLIFRICMYMSIGCLLATLLCFKRHPMSLKEMERRDTEVTAQQEESEGERV